MNTLSAALLFLPVFQAPQSFQPVGADASGDESNNFRAEIAWVDLDGDGHQDTFLVDREGAAKVLRNLGEGEFIDVTVESGLSGLDTVHFLLPGDVDGDGTFDLGIAWQAGGFSLFKNRGGAFELVTDLALGESVYAAHWLENAGTDRASFADIHLATSNGHRIGHHLGDFLFTEFILPVQPGRDGGNSIATNVPISTTNSESTTSLGTVGETSEQPESGHAHHSKPRRDVDNSVPTNGTASAQSTVGTPGTLGSLGSTPPNRPGKWPLYTCATTIHDEGGGSCLSASSAPTLGMLYPLSKNLFVAPSGRVGIGTTAPSAQFGLSGNMRLESDVSGIIFSSASGVTSPMITMFASGTQNATRMVLAHSASSDDWGLRYDDSQDTFEFVKFGVPAVSIDLQREELRIAGDLDVTGDFDMAGNFDITGDVDVAGDLNIAGGLQLRAGSFSQSVDTTQVVLHKLEVTNAALVGRTAWFLATANGPGEVTNGGPGMFQVYRNGIFVVSLIVAANNTAAQMHGHSLPNLILGDVIELRAHASNQTPMLIRDVTVQITHAQTASIGGSGTASFLPKWDASASLTDSVISEDVLGNVQVGTTFSAGKLNVGDSFGLFDDAGILRQSLDDSIHILGQSAFPGRSIIRGPGDAVVIDGATNSINVGELDAERLRNFGKIEVLSSFGTSGFLIGPETATSVDPMIGFAEDQALTTGMSILYDRFSDDLGIYGTPNATSGSTPWVVVQKNSGRVGIGNTSPTGTLDVQGAGFGITGATIRSVNTAANGRALYAQATSSGGAVAITQLGTGPALAATQQSTGNIIEGIVGSSVVFEVTNTGRVVTSALEITGGGDLVEAFDSTIDCEPGMVVVIDDKNPGALRPSTRAYDPKVAGAVSGAGNVRHGLKLTQAGVLEGDTLVALTGRVYVKCTTANGPIQPGDRLTSSNLAGHAMRATDPERCDGAVLGKAMSALDEGTGLVLVLVNLQ